LPMPEPKSRMRRGCVAQPAVTARSALTLYSAKYSSASPVMATLAWWRLRYSSAKRSNSAIFTAAIARCGILNSDSV
jgi:hypothetical protein